MSREITHRAIKDRDFVAAVRSDPSAALAEYELSNEAITAIESGDEGQIRSALAQEYRAGVPNY